MLYEIAIPQENKVTPKLAIPLNPFPKNAITNKNISLKASNVSIELRHATRYLDNIKAEEKLTGILSVGLLVERFPDEKL